MKTKYTTTGKTVNKRDLPKVIKMLRTIEKDVGAVTPALVVSRASNKSSPLHKYFEWNNSRAADLYRLEQARRLIRCVEVEFTSPGGQIHNVRAFVNIRPDSDDETNPLTESGYVGVQGIKTNAGFKNQVLAYARQQIKTWRERFGAFREFSGIVHEIDKL